MKVGLLSLAAIALVCLLQSSSILFAQSSLLTLAGGAGSERFNGLFELSDGTILVGGQADDLNWLPPGTPVTTLSVPGAFSSSSVGVAFLMRLSADQQNILQVVKFPDNTVRDIFKIRTNSAPGQPTDDLFISGNLEPGPNLTDWYFIGRLDNNFINGVPTGLVFYREVNTRGRNPSDRSMLFPESGNESIAKQYQVWDVGSNGIIYFATGADVSFDSHGIDVMNLIGQDTLVEYFPLHSTGNSTPGFQGIPASAYTNNTGDPRFDLRRSNTWFKYNGTGVPGSFRSYSQVLYDSLMTDENGNPGRKGAYPFDAFFNSPQLLFGNPAVFAGSGYTGYFFNAGGGKWTARISGITIDRRSNDVFMAVSLATTSSNNIPGFNDSETALACLSNNGQMKWWARLHKEDSRNSPAQQHIEGIDIDYANNQIVVVGRTRGDAVNNFWNGNQLFLKPGGSGFQNGLTGDIPAASPLDYSWLGKYDLSTGKIRHATYVAELADDAALGQASQQAILDGWPNLNAYAAKLGQTRVNGVHVNPLTGEVAILATASRTITTANAFQKMLKPGDPTLGQGTAPLNAFVRVYNANLDTLKYSSLVTGIWNPGTALGADNTVLRGVMARNGGVLVSGFHRVEGNDIPTASVPAWGTAIKNGIGALFANLNFDCQGPAQTTAITGPADLCAGTEITYEAAPVTGVTSYSWYINAAGWTGSSSTNSITLTRPGTSNGGTLYMVANNNCGVSLQRLVNLPRSTNLFAPVSPTFPADHCLNTTRPYSVNQVQGATSYNWTLSGAGCGGFTLGSTSTSGNFVDITRTTVTSPCTLNVQVEGCGTPSNTVGFPLPDAGIDVPVSPAFLNTPITICEDITKTVSVSPVTGATGYLWTLNGTGWSGGSSTSSIELTPVAGAGQLQLSVVAIGACGNSNPANVTISAPTEGSLPNAPGVILGFVDGHCNGETLNYSVAGNPGETYQWSLSNTVWTLADSTGTSVALTAPSAGANTVNLVVTATNSCGTGNTSAITVARGAPGQPAVISPSTISICENQNETLSTNSVIGATYNWLLPNNWTGSSTTNVITITPVAGAEAGNLSVTATNRCGVSPVRNLALSAPGTGGTRTLTVSMPGSTGEVIACQGTARTAWVTANDDTDITNYIWQFPQGWTFINSSSSAPGNDTIRFSAGVNAVSGTGRVTLVGTNGICGTVTFQVIAGLGSTPGAIAGPLSLCINPAPSNYSIDTVSGADSYNWQIIPANAGTFVVAPDGLSITVTWNAAFVGAASIRVRGVSTCGPGAFGPAANVEIGVLPPSAAAINRCGPGDVELIASGAPAGGSYNWYSAASGGTVLGSGSSFTVNVTQDTSYYVSALNGNGCESETRTQVTVTITSPVTVSIQTPTQTTFCTGNDPIQLVGTPAGGTYSGTPGVNASGLFSPALATLGANKIYYLIDAGGGCTGIDSVTVTVNEAPSIDPPLPNLSVCANGAPLTLATPGSGTWTGTGVSDNIFTPQSGQTGTVVVVTYAVTQSGCTSTQNVDITVEAPPTVNAGENQDLCQSASATTLTGTPAGGTWLPGGTFDPAGQPLNTPIRYIYSFTDPATTCSASDSVFLTVISNPSVNVGAPDTIVCANTAAYQLIPINGVWIGSPAVTAGGIFNPAVITPGNTITLTVTVTIGTCVGTATKNITVNPIPVFDVGTADTSVCTGSAAFQLPTPNGGTWSGSPAVSTTGLFTPSQLSPGQTANLVYTAVNAGCSGTATKNITLAPLPTFNVGQADTSICAGSEPFQLPAPQGGTWSGSPAISAGGLVTPSLLTPGQTVNLTYTATLNGCAGTANKNITVAQPPVVNVGAADTTVCSNAATFQLLTPSAGQWSGSIAVSATGLFTPSQVTGLPAVVTLNYIANVGGCAASATKTINVNPPPTIALGADTAVCESSAAFTLIATPQGGAWTGGDFINASGIFTPSAASGTVSVTYTVTSGGCFATASKSITLQVVPQVQFTQTTFDVCQGLDIQLTGATPAGGLWSGNGVSATGLFTAATLSPGDYTINYTVGQAGCSGSGNVTVAINPTPTVNAGEDKAITEGQTVMLNGSGSAGTVLWSPSDDGLSAINILTPEASPVATTEYTLTITTEKGCSASDVVSVTVSNVALVVPKGFTPNNDGDNDVWIIQNIDRYPGNKVKVFNRWGAEVFSKDGYSNTNAWNGENLPTGTYYYVVEPGIGEKTLTGTLTILK